MIELENIHKQLDGASVLQGASLTVKRGEFLALIGQSGGGKSVILKHMAGLMQPDKGRVTVDGNDLRRLNRRKLQRLRQRFGFVFQNGALFDSMSVYENIAFPLREKNHLKEREIRDRVQAEIQQVGLEGAEQKLPAHLSGGMIKRAALARALIVEPEIVFFDEPVTGLDPMIGQAIMELIHACHHDYDFTAVIVSHQLLDIFTIVDTVAMLHNGKIYTTGTPEEIQNSRDEVVHDFVTGNIHGLAGKLGVHR